MGSGGREAGVSKRGTSLCLSTQRVLLSVQLNS